MKPWPLSQSACNFKSSLMHQNTMVVEWMPCYHATDYLDTHGGAQPNMAKCGKTSGFHCSEPDHSHIQKKKWKLHLDKVSWNCCKLQSRFSKPTGKYTRAAGPFSQWPGVSTGDNKRYQEGAILFRFVESCLSCEHLNAIWFWWGVHHQQHGRRQLQVQLFCQTRPSITDKDT